VTQGRWLIDQAGSDSKMYIGWNDEGHDQDQQQRTGEIRDRLAGFQEFNRTQDPKFLAVKPH
jgi:hypothetical protein